MNIEEPEVDEGEDNHHRDSFASAKGDLFVCTFIAMGISLYCRVSCIHVDC